MKTNLRRLDADTIPALLALMPYAWALDDEDYLRELFRWRYLDRPAGGVTWVALDGDRCVGLIDSYLRPYLIDGRRVLLRETADWFCLPQYRAFGVGLRLMRMMMGLPEPLINIGGTEASRSLLPRLGWMALASVQRLILPVSVRGCAGNLLRRSARPTCERYARAIPQLLRRTPRRILPPSADAQVERWFPGQELAIPLPRQGGLIGLLERADLEWICSAPPRLFRPIVMTFRIAGQVVGISLSQLEPSPSGLDGRIVHLQSFRDEEPLLSWLVRETVCRLVEAGAGLIRCRASTAALIGALRRIGFLRVRCEPAVWWTRDAQQAPTRFEVSFLRADDALPCRALNGMNGGT